MMGEKLKIKCLGTSFTSSSISLVGAEGSHGPQDPVLLGLGVSGVIIAGLPPAII